MTTWAWCRILAAYTELYNHRAATEARLVKQGLSSKACRTFRIGSKVENRREISNGSVAQRMCFSFAIRGRETSLPHVADSVLSPHETEAMHGMDKRIVRALGVLMCVRRWATALVQAPSACHVPGTCLAVAATATNNAHERCNRTSQIRLSKATQRWTGCSS